MEGASAPAQRMDASHLPQLYSALMSALSPDPAVQRPAEAAMHAWETNEGFVSCLAEVIGAKDAEHSARWLASVHLKNTVTRQWRSLPGRESIQPAEKQHLRQKLLQLIPQDDPQLAVQVALVVAKVARVDFPARWPSLFGDMMQMMEAAEQQASGSAQLLVVKRVLLAIHHILKELSTKRLAADTATFQKVTEQLFTHLWQRWLADSKAVVDNLPAALVQPSPHPVLHSLERCLLLTKAIRKLLLFGYASEARTLRPAEAVAHVMPAMAALLQQLLQMRPLEPRSPSQLFAMTDRLALKLCRTLSDVLDQHPWSLYQAGVLLSAMEFFCNQLERAAAAGGVRRLALLHQKLLLCMTEFLCKVLSSLSYRGASGLILQDRTVRDNAAAFKSMAAEVQDRLKSFWETGERAARLLTVLVRGFLALTPEDLREWDADAEAYYHATRSAAAHDASLHHAAEDLLFLLINRYRDQLAPVLVQMLKAASDASGQPAEGGASVAAAAQAQVLGKEAVYRAVARCAEDLFDLVDFAPWFHSVLVHEMADRRPMSAPLRAQAARLTEQWAGKLPQASRHAAFQALGGMLQESDAVLQLTAVDAMQGLVMDWDFEEEQLAGQLGSLFQQLAALLQVSLELDTQTKALELLTATIERMPHSIEAHTPALLSSLPQIWTQAAGQPLLRMQILRAMQRLVNVLGVQSPAAYPVLLPMLQTVMQPAAEADTAALDAESMKEDALELWLVALRNAPDGSLALLELVPALLAQQALGGLDGLQLLLNICQSALLLGRDPLLQHVGGQMCAMLQGMVGDVNEKGMVMVLGLMETLLLCGGLASVELLQGALLKLLRQLLQRQEGPLSTARSLLVLARILMLEPPSADALPAALAMLQAYAAAASSTVDAVLQDLVQVWEDSHDTLSQPGARRLSALGCCHLLALPCLSVLQHLPSLVSVISQAWNEVEGQGELDVMYSYRIGASYGEESVIDLAGWGVTASEEAEGESVRLQALRAADPLTHARLPLVLQAALTRATATHGAAVQAALNSMDTVLQQQLKAMLPRQA